MWKWLLLIAMASAVAGLAYVGARETPMEVSLTLRGDCNAECPRALISAGQETTINGMRIYQDDRALHVGAHEYLSVRDGDSITIDVDDDALKVSVNGSPREPLR